MKIDMTMPKMGESITEGTILKWLKKEGDRVERDEVILEISTDKVDSEIPSPASGVLKKILAPEGETVQVGSVIAEIETEVEEGNGKDEKAAAAVTETAEAEPVAAPTPQPAAEPVQEHKAAPSAGKAAEPPPPTPQAEPSTEETRRFYSPLVRSIAAKEGISLEELKRIPGTGRGGRVTKNDILRYIEEKKRAPQVAPEPAKIEPAPAEAPAVQPRPAPAAPAGLGERVEVVPMDHMRKMIAEHMVKSVHTSPHVYSFSEADVSHLVAYRNRVKDEFLRREGFKLTFTPFFMYAAAKALKDFPMVNASVDGDRILLKKDINIGMAVALDQGLIVPVVKNADTLTLVGMARAVNDLAERARNKKLLPDEVQDGTFTITNLGSFGSLIGTPIISQPQVAILGVGVIKKRVVVVNDAIAIRDMVYLSLGFDHRIIDGALGGMFLERVVKYLQEMEPDKI